MTRRNRVIYASQSVIVDGKFLYRVQTLGSTSTFTSEDVFELGQLEIIDVVDDVPTVAVTIDTNDWGSIFTMAALAGVDSRYFNVSATSGNANLTVDSGTGSNVAYYHGVALSDFGLDSAQVQVWAPIQTESALGTDNDLIDQTLFMNNCYVNNLEFSYGAGANGTENYSLETDNKMWLLNDGRFVNQEEWDFTTAASGTIELCLSDATGVIPTLSSQKRAFLLKTAEGAPALALWDASATTPAWTKYEILTDSTATATQANYDSSTHVITLPTGFTSAAGDKARVLYAADEYAVAGNSGTVTADRIAANYFTAATADSTVTGGAPESLGAVRQGQIEIFLVDPTIAPADYAMSLRITSATVTASLTRETLTELGHLKPYYRTVTFPTEITTSLETTAGDLETYARIAGKYTEFANNTLLDLSIDDILVKDNLILVVMIYEQTDEEAGGSYSSRIVKTGASIIGKEYFIEGQKYTYAALDREYPVKTLIVPGLKMTDEAYNLAVGSNATQTFGFRSTNKLFAVQGFVPINHLFKSPGFEKNA